jgi:hypothetical protein
MDFVPAKYNAGREAILMLHFQDNNERVLQAQKECTEEVIRTVARTKEEFTQNKDKPSHHAGNALGKMQKHGRSISRF